VVGEVGSGDFPLCATIAHEFHLGAGGFEVVEQAGPIQKPLPTLTLQRTPTPPHPTPHMPLIPLIRVEFVTGGAFKSQFVEVEGEYSVEVGGELVG